MSKKLFLQDVVTWASSGNGSELSKTGEVVAIVAPGTLPDPKFKIAIRPTVQGRSHESYVIKVRKGKYYWPIVAKLQVIQGRVGAATPANSPVPPKTVVIPPKAVAPSNQPITKTLQTNATAPEPVLKNYVAICLDFSGSMSSLSTAAATDYNTLVGALKDSAATTGQQVYLETSKFGHASTNQSEVISSFNPVSDSHLLSRGGYQAAGPHTPLFDAVDQTIERLKAQPGSEDPNVSYLVIVTTDGSDNASLLSGFHLAQRIQALSQTDRWTITFRVPNGSKNTLVRAGIPAGNIIEWEQTQRGVEAATATTVAAVQNYATMRSQGVRGTNSFFANIDVDDKTLKSTLTDISQQMLVWPVYNDSVIQSFVENQGQSFGRGSAYYQLTKPEEVQDYKDILVQDKVDGKIYGGLDARNLLKLPTTGTIRLRPGNTGHYDVFIQSTSVNRKLIGGTRMIYKR